MTTAVTSGIKVWCPQLSLFCFNSADSCRTEVHVRVIREDDELIDIQDKCVSPSLLQPALLCMRLFIPTSINLGNQLAGKTRGCGGGTERHEASEPRERHRGGGDDR